MYSMGSFGDEDEEPEGETIPTMLIRNNAVNGYGRGWLTKNRPYTGEQLVAGLTLITTGGGESTIVHGFNSFIMGAKFDVAISLADIFPQLSWPTPQSSLMNWTETPIDVPFLTNTWITSWRSGEKDISRGDIFLSQEGKDVLKAGRDPTTKELEDNPPEGSSDSPAKIPVCFSYRYVVAAVSGSRAKLGVQIIPTSLDHVDSVVWKDSPSMGGVFSWISRSIGWFPMMNARHNLQGPAAYIAPLNSTDDFSKVGTMTSDHYRKEIRAAILTAKCPMELQPDRAAEYVAHDIHRMFPAKPAEVPVISEKDPESSEPPLKVLKKSGAGDTGSQFPH